MYEVLIHAFGDVMESLCVVLEAGGARLEYHFSLFSQVPISPERIAFSRSS